MSTPPPEHVQPDYPLARLTTIRTGGDAAWFARPRRVTELQELLRWAEAEGLGNRADRKEPVQLDAGH